MSTAKRDARVLKAQRQKFFDSVWSHVLVIVLLVIWLIPIAWVIANSFREQPGLLSPTFFPNKWTLNNFKELFKVTGSRKYGKWVWNTLQIALLNMLFSTFFTLITAYSLSRFRFKMRKPLMNISLILGMFPGFMAMVAIYLILNLMGLIGNKWALLLVYSAGSGLGFFVAKGYFDSMPAEIDEAAKLDGASQFRVFFQIFLPMAKPIMIYTALMAFMAPWSDYILAGLILRNPNEMTVAVGLYNMTADTSAMLNNFTTFAAGSILIAIPIVVLYISLQRFMIEGISSGAVKG
mgnify:CR=1 FL=1